MALEGEEQLFALPAFQTFLTKDEQPVSVRLLKKGVKHVLSHQILYTDFYEWNSLKILVLLPDLLK